MTTREPLLVIITGGTIDSKLDPATDAIIPTQKSEVVKYLKTLKLHNRVRAVTLCLKDSREILEQDRKNMLDAIQKSRERLILITHGTYTMAETGIYLQEHIDNTKTIILTGSMIPVTGFSSSDAPFNLGYALAALQMLEKGVYLCMNGRVFNPKSVKKNIGEGRFEEI